MFREISGVWISLNSWTERTAGCSPHPKLMHSQQESQVSQVSRISINISSSTKRGRRRGGIRRTFCHNWIVISFLHTDTIIFLSLFLYPISFYPISLSLPSSFCPPLSFFISFYFAELSHISAWALSSGSELCIALSLLPVLCLGLYELFCIALLTIEQSSFISNEQGTVARTKSLLCSEHWGCV